MCTTLSLSIQQLKDNCVVFISWLLWIEQPWTWLIKCLCEKISTLLNICWGMVELSHMADLVSSLGEFVTLIFRLLGPVCNPTNSEWGGGSFSLCPTPPPALVAGCFVELDYSDSGVKMKSQSTFNWHIPSFKGCWMFSKIYFFSDFYVFF